MTTPTTAPADLAAAVANRLAGEVIAPGHREYETARRVWNGIIDRRPAAIARCAADVATFVRVAAAHGLPLALPGGGHNVARTADPRRTVRGHGGAIPPAFRGGPR